MSFRNDFVWGAATASYQIEGAARDDGRTPTVWDMFCRRDGVVWRGHNGDVACDHYHRFRDDVALMRDIGLKAYRFSIAWSRVMPGGVGAVNEAGIGFYDELVDTLLAAGITPYVTLFHWDFPLNLYYRGGWLNPDSPQWFADYANVVVAALSDRVRHWMTLNEPQCFIGLGLRDGVHAPGDSLPWKEVLQAGHHTLLAHGRAVQAIRAGAKTDSTIGFAPVGTVRMPVTNDPRDVEAARSITFSVPVNPKGADGGATLEEALAGSYWNNTWFADPIFFKQYPEDGLAFYGADAPAIRANDMDIISQPIDFYGVNIYFGEYVRAGADGHAERVPMPLGEPLTGYGWSITPEALYWGPRFLYERYGKPVIVTENGCGYFDVVSTDGKVHDPYRIDYLTRYIGALKRAAQDGVDVRGYFLWSLMDNFEWQEGFKQRFGITYVDYVTQQRIPKDSAAFYREIIAANGENIPAYGTAPAFV